MIIAALMEAKDEQRVAITPANAKKYIDQGFKVILERHAGEKAGFSDEDYQNVGVELLKTKKNILNQADILLAVSAPSTRDLKLLHKEALVIAGFDLMDDSKQIETALESEISLISMNAIPRISRAQAMDSLSSQASLAGYRAVIEACGYYQRALPMMMTAAGMIHPAKVLILGAGVAGLQAIATAKRMGAVVYAFDVRKAAKEQVESLGAEFIEVADEEDAETASGYAKETSAEYQRKQSLLIDQYAGLSDIIITTALIPGRKAPVLLHKETVELMKPGSVIVDMASAKGGNCELSEDNMVIDYQGITIIGNSLLASRIAATASELYSNNLTEILKLITKEGTLVLSPDDQIIQHSLICHQGKTLPYQPARENA